MKKTALLVCLALCATASARPLEAIRSAGTIKIATEGAFPPFNYYEGKKLTGFEVELGNALAKELGLKVEWVTQPFDNLLIGLGQNRFDFVIASHGVTEERAKAVNFTNPHYCTGGVIVSKKGGPKTAAALRGKTVAVQVGTSYLENVRKVAGTKEVKTFPKDTDALQNLLAGRSDAWVSDKFVAIDAIKANTRVGLQQGDMLFQEKIAMAVAKGNTSLQGALNDALKKVQANGTYAKISKKYFDQDIRCK
ncbi:polar amino acid transport system substrate-binding protein [Deinobacterium chartae]|uniref:Polar amino acid transport system substrate-binding protein n=1 Tax=Deinobacterium chartae TaxID=521158 RepID=A0A841I0V1_9DEIO|nr:ABC transporter substrate-binding protein [Deinobacterium chartae]MBB6098039.1 polar amino acid transport system substrate-binding protein [Deinobacterium chartae]